MPQKIAVVYLTRLHEGFAAFEAFADSYRRHTAGEPHDFVIICKGFKKPGEFAAVGAIFTGIPHKIISMPDEIGLDIHAYREAALQLSNEYICCLNTFAGLRSDDWLKKLWKNLSKPGVGLVGATGSLESLYSTYRVVDFVAWAATRPARFDEKFARDYAWLLNTASPQTMKALNSLPHRLRRHLGDILRNRPTLTQLKKDHPGVWAESLSHNTSRNSAFREFPHFPNPHIRSNAFLVRRVDLLAIPLEDKGKIAACNFESGAAGLSISVLKRGLDILVVGADGVGYTMDQWATCGSFRSGDQSNILVSDNQCQVFDNYSPEVKRAHQIMTWGGYSPDISSGIDLHGVSFGGETPLYERVEQFKAIPKAKRERLFSIAIPTHNRLDLVLEAIQTVKRQNYHNWEVVVFDNASKEPVADAIKALGDSRIRSKRSDVFLPVTGSWNNAINMAKGEYVTMVGDDDGIAPNYFERMNYLMDQFENPDLVFANLYQFMHPGVVPGHRQGYVSDLPMADFLADRDAPFVVDAETIRRSVDNSLKMRRSFMFNMPAFCCSRALLDRMRVDGQVLHSPFPDYYFANIALHLADKVVGEPRRTAFQGVSKVSFGFTLMNAKTDDGFKVLNHDVANDRVYSEVAKYLLPGSRYMSEYIVTMAYVSDLLADKDRKPDFRHYRRHQIWQYLKSQGSIARWQKTDSGKIMWGLLSPEEKRWAMKSNFIHKLSIRLPRLFRMAANRIEQDCSAYLFRVSQIVYRSGEHVNLIDVFKDIEETAFSKPIKTADVVTKRKATNSTASR